MNTVKRLGVILAIVVCVTASAGCQTGGKVAKSGKVDRTPTALRFVNYVTSGQYSNATGLFDSGMSIAMSADELENAWNKIVAQCGTFKKTGETRTDQQAGYDIVFVECQFEKQSIDAKIVFNSDGKISGLWFVPHIAKADTSYTDPSYADQSKFDEKDVTVGNGEWKLPGTLTIPKGKGPFPVVVLVHGSGPNDRDESLGPNKPFKDLAWGLASRGIAVLRYDKRTKVYAAKLASSSNITVKEETIDDAVAAVSLLRGTKEVDSKRIFVLGHSLGGMLIPRIAKADPKITGLIVMAGPTRPFEDAILDQYTYLASLNDQSSQGVQKQLDQIREQVENVKSPDLSPKTPASSLPFGVPASYWLDLRGYHPAEVAKSLKQPMLILQGARDYQVSEQDFKGWKSALSGRSNVTFKFYTNLNHCFMDGQGKSTPEEYEKHGSVSQSAIEDIAKWVAQY